MLVHAPSGPHSPPAAAIVKCKQLFGAYPLAVTRDPADGSRSMVLMDWTAAGGCFFTLTQAREGLFAIRPWSGQDAGGEIGPREAVEDAIVRVIANGMPVPRDGALFGWVPDRQVTAMLSVHSGHPPGSGAAVSVPEIQVMPMAGTGGLDWPPFTASPFVDGRLWDYLDRGQIVDVVPLLTGFRRAGVPGAQPERAQPQARRTVHRRHREPDGRGVLAARRRLHGSIAAVRRCPRAARKASARSARHRALRGGGCAQTNTQLSEHVAPYTGPHLCPRSRGFTPSTLHSPERALRCHHAACSRAWRPGILAGCGARGCV